MVASQGGMLGRVGITALIIILELFVLTDLQKNIIS
jgi:hypothetical protein